MRFDGLKMGKLQPREGAWIDNEHRIRAMRPVRIFEVLRTLSELARFAVTRAGCARPIDRLRSSPALGHIRQVVPLTISLSHGS